MQHSIETLTSVCKNFELEGKPVLFEALTDGHINDTYKVEWMFPSGHFDRFILQRINTNILKNYRELTENIDNVCEYLKRMALSEGKDPLRTTLTYIRSKDGNSIYTGPEGCWRLSIYIRNSTAHQSADLPGLMSKAAEGFGHFQYQLSNFPAEILHETIPNFHNTVSRLSDFDKAVKDDVAGRAGECGYEIEEINKRRHYCGIITDAIAKGEIPLRVTHNDTKLNNIMIDDFTGEGICVIDLDTVMPGSMLYDFGDSIRFAASNAVEDEKDLEKVFLRLDLYEEYVSGYLKGVGKNITKNEIKLLSLSSFILTFELVLRFLGDYLNGDVYFKTSFPEHNLQRARAQLKLAQDIESKLPQMDEIVRKYAHIKF